MLGARDTDRLRLEPWSEAAHTPALAVANADPAVMRHIALGETLDAPSLRARGRRLRVAQASSLPEWSRCHASRCAFVVMAGLLYWVGVKREKV